MDNIPEDFFTRELDAALLSGKADVAVHSAKDLPYPLPEGLELYCLTQAKDKSDSLVSNVNLKLSELPAGARVGTSSSKRKEELLKQRPDLEIVAIRGTIEERIAQVDNGHIDALIVASCALERLGLSWRATEKLPFATHPLQAHLAVVGKAGNATLKNIFTSIDTRRKYGKVTLVGFGPGNPDLLTIKGDKALQAADVIFHDDLIDLEYLNRYEAVKVYVGKRKGRHSHEQDEINEMVYRSAVEGRATVRLKGGDPMLFAHGREEIDFLQSRLVEVEVIPGISSAIALSAYTHIPLTYRGLSSSVAFVTGHSCENLQTPDADTLVYYMGGANIAFIARKLLEAGRDEDTPVALVYGVSQPDQKTFFTNLKELQFSIIKYPTPILVLVGKVVGFENRKPSNMLVTGLTCEEYSGNNEITHTPLIKIQQAAAGCCDLANKIAATDRIIFTSRYGVRFFFELLDEQTIDIRTLTTKKIDSVGHTTTAELKKHHIIPDIEPVTESAEGLLKYYRSIDLKGERILLPRSDKALRSLPDELTQMGNEVTELIVYENKNNHEVERSDLSHIDKIVFTSPSGVDAFKSLYGELPEGKQLIARGLTTLNKL